MVPTAKSCSLALSGLSRSLQGQAVAATGKTATGKRRWNPHEPIVCQVPILVMPVEYLNSDGSSLFSGDVRMINSMIKNTISMPQFWSGNVKLAPGNVKPWNLGAENSYIIFSKNPSSLADVAWRPKHRFFSSKHRPEASTSFSG